jgi:hypothetical protein
MCGWIDIGGGGEGGRVMRREKMKYKENEKTGRMNWEEKNEEEEEEQCKGWSGIVHTPA